MFPLSLSLLLRRMLIMRLIRLLILILRLICLLILRLIRLLVIMLLILRRVHHLWWIHLWRWPPAISTLPSLVPPLPWPVKGGRSASFSLCALLVEDCSLPNLILSGLSGLWDISLLDIFSQHFKKQKINETFSYGQINNISNNTTTTIKFRQCRFNL